MLGPQHPLAGLQCAAQEWFGVAVAALGLVQDGQVVDAAEGTGVLGPQHPLAGLQCVAEERLGLAVAALDAIKLGQVVDADECIRMLGTPHPPGISIGDAGDLLGLGIAALYVQSDADAIQGIDRGLRIRLGPALLPQGCGHLIDQGLIVRCRGVGPGMRGGGQGQRQGQAQEQGAGRQGHSDLHGDKPGCGNAKILSRRHGGTEKKQPNRVLDLRPRPGAGQVGTRQRRDQDTARYRWRSILSVMHFLLCASVSP